MSAETPDHRDAGLALRVDELRRAAVMRESRAAPLRKLWPLAYQNAEWVTRETARGELQRERFRARVLKVLETQ